MSFLPRQESSSLEEVITSKQIRMLKNINVGAGFEPARPVIIILYLVSWSLFLEIILRRASHPGVRISGHSRVRLSIFSAEIEGNFSLSPIL
jgi:hypothetical protein